MKLNEKRVCLTILLAYLTVGGLFAGLTPAWQAPDEPAHYNAIRQIAEAGCCPRIETGDWSSAYLAQLTSGRFAPDLLDELHSVQYEDHQPPLYYLLASLFYRLSDGDLLALRLFSLSLGAGVVALSYLVCRLVLPAKPGVALGTMALVAFLPQHLHIMSAVNNDALAELVVGLALYCCLRYLKDETMPVWGLGLLVGLAFLTKLTISFLALPAVLVVWLRWRRGEGPVGELLRSVAIFALAAGLLGGIWWLRNISVYGVPDFLGLAAHDAVVADQPRTVDFVAEHGALTAWSQMALTTFKSFWGQFGWMALPLDGALGGLLYPCFALLTLSGLSGAALAGIRRRAIAALWLLLVIIVVVALQYAYYNLEFRQWQGRYLFPALIPIAILMAYGIDYWLERFLPGVARRTWLLPLGLFGLLALDVYLLYRVIVPGLSPA